MQPKTILNILLALVVISLIIAFSTVEYLQYSMEMTVVSVVAFLSFLFLVTIMLIVDMKSYTIYPGSVGVNSTGEIIQTFPNRIRVWNKKYPDESIITLLDKQLRLRMDVTPITENPKVRKIEFSIGFDALTSTVEGWNKVLIWVQEKFTGKSSEEFIRKRLQYELYEFNDKHSSDMAKFSNPLNEDQQSEFKKLLMNFLENRVPEVVVINKVRFSLP